MSTSEPKNLSGGAILPRPVDRTLRILGREISTARRVRRLSQEDLAQRMGTSLSTVRRMESGYPGTALHAFLRALHVLGRLDDVAKALSTENDALGMDLVREQLPQRVRSHRDKARPARPVGKVSDGVDADELEGF